MPIPLNTGVTAEAGAPVWPVGPLAVVVPPLGAVAAPPVGSAAPLPKSSPELIGPVAGAVNVGEDVKPPAPDAGADAGEKLSTKAGEASELTCTVARYRAMIWSSGSGTGSSEVTFSGSRDETLLASESRV